MRIAFHVPRASFLRPGSSGDSVQVASILDGLRAHGHDVQIVSKLDARELGRGRVPLHRFVREAVRVRRRMGRFEPDAWLVYMPSVTSPDLFGWWQRPARYVLFAAYHGRPERVRRRLWRHLFAAVHRRSMLAAHAVTVYRPQSVTRMMSEGVGRERIFLLPPAVNVPDSLMPKQEARRMLGLASDAAVVLCVARFTGPGPLGRPGKTASILELLRVVKTLPEWVVCVLVGDGPGRDEIEEETARLGLERVRLTGLVPNRDIPVYHAASDVFAYPYDLDRPSMAVMEAQANGRPVVRMRSPSAELAVEEGRTGLLAEDIDDFRTLLEQLLIDRVRCEAMGEAARDYIARAHSVDVRVRQTLTLLSQPGGARPEVDMEVN